MPSHPVGDPAPENGGLPEQSLARLPDAPFGVYIHVPFCAVRCGYCDFNTYVPGEAGGSPAIARYLEAAEQEILLARRVLGDGAPTVDTVFLGGGTPTMLDPGDIARLLRALRNTFELAPGAEVTLEANPDSVDHRARENAVEHLAGEGVTRMSLGMQSAVPHVLAELERTHRPENVRRAVELARAAGMAVSVDLIYGASGESPADWATSLHAAVDLGVDHISAYALVVEEGTRLATRVRRGLTRAPSEDDQAAKYETADRILSAAGLGWYEVSNWARRRQDRCRHNELYWRNGSWWGIGPGAHSHVGGTRWWNVRQPDRYAEALERDRSPAQAREVLSDEERHEELVMLRTRLVDGLPARLLHAAGRAAVPGLAGDGLIETRPDGDDDVRLVLTLPGRLLADLVVRRLLGW